VKKLLAALFAVAIGTASQSLLAQGLYLGAGVGQANVDIECDLDISCSADDSDTVFKIFGGWKFTPNWAVELAYVEGGEYTASGTDSSLGTADAKIDVSGFNLAALGILPISEKFSVQGKVGIFFWDQDATANSTVFGSESFSESGNDPMFGVGATWNFSKQFGLLVEYEKFLDVGNKDTTGESDVDVLSASLVFNF